MLKPDAAREGRRARCTSSWREIEENELNFDIPRSPRYHALLNKLDLERANSLLCVPCELYALHPRGTRHGESCGGVCVEKSRFVREIQAKGAKISRRALLTKCAFSFECPGFFAHFVDPSHAADVWVGSCQVCAQLKRGPWTSVCVRSIDLELPCFPTFLQNFDSKGRQRSAQRR
jgi:hypothetical protein